MAPFGRPVGTVFGLIVEADYSSEVLILKPRNREVLKARNEKDSRPEVWLYKCVTCDLRELMFRHFSWLEILASFPSFTADHVRLCERL